MPENDWGLMAFLFVRVSTSDRLALGQTVHANAIAKRSIVFGHRPLGVPERTTAQEQYTGTGIRRTAGRTDFELLGR